MNISKYILVFSLLLSSSFFICSSSILASVNIPKKVYGTRSNKTTSNTGVSDPTNQDKVVSSNSNKVKVDSSPTTRSQASPTTPIISKAPLDPSTATVLQDSMSAKTANITSKPAPAVHTVLSSGTTAVAKSPSLNSSSNTLGIGDYKASIYFKDGEKRDGVILSTSTGNIYEIRFAGEKNVKQYNVNSIARIERNGEGVTTNAVATSLTTQVAVDYKASIYFKDGSKRDGTILSTSTHNIYNIKFAGEKDIKQYNANTIERIEPKGKSSSSVAPIIIPVATSSSKTTKKVTTSKKKSHVPDWKPYKALVYLKNGTKIDGIVVSEGVDLVKVKVTGGSVIDAKSNEISKIDRT